MSVDIFRAIGRRTLLSSLAFGGVSVFWAPGAFAEELERTPRIGEGPYYPTKLPLDTDNDLLIISDAISPAVGDVTHLGGRILDSKGDPVRNALVEIWQCDRDGTYLKPHLDRGDKYDTNFQGFGRFLTGSTGEYYFRTIKPVPYTGRPAAHIHFKVRRNHKVVLTTECFVKGYAGNERDGIYRAATATKAGKMLPVDFAPVKDSRIGELAATFNIVLGVTPES
jgi:protocatechuate 3,4-dioxygenase beta subunit